MNDGFKDFFGGKRQEMSWRFVGPYLQVVSNKQSAKFEMMNSLIKIGREEIELEVSDAGRSLKEMCACEL